MVWALEYPHRDFQTKYERSPKPLRFHASQLLSISIYFVSNMCSVHVTFIFFRLFVFLSGVTSGALNAAQYTEFYP
jgi:hypothetical protein